MTKTLTLFLPDGVTAAPLSDFGSVNPGTTAASRSLLLKNTGTEAVPSIRARIEQTSITDGEYRATISSIALTGTNQEVLTAPLAVGASIGITESWTVPAGVTGSVDMGALVLDYDV
jgi:hypothetical protein